MATGLLDLLGGAFGTTPPSYMEGLLGAQKTDDLQKQSIGTGLVNALIGYAAMPKNQNLGLGRILAGTAQAGIQGAQGVYDSALQDYQTQAKISEMKRQQEQQTSARQAVEQLLLDPKVASDPMAVAFIKSNPMEALKLYATPRDRKTATVNNQVIDTATGDVIFTGAKDPKALPTYDVQEGRTKVTYQVQPDGTAKVIGRGSMDAPDKLSYKTETGADGNIYYVPTKPNSPILDVSGRPTNAFKPAGAKPTEDQSKAAGWLNQTQQAYKNMQKVMFKTDTQGNKTLNLDVIQPSTQEKVYGVVGAQGAAQSPKRQQFVQAASTMSEALLRAATGAGINESEAAQKIAEITPQYFDSEAVIQQKLAAIPVYIESLKTRANVKNTSAPQKAFNIGGQNLVGKLGADGNYYVTQGGKTFRVEE
jgi:hypothetical protein